MKITKNILSLLTVATAIYVLLYFIFITRAAPSIDKNGDLEFASCPRFAKFQRVDGDFTVITGRSNIANYIFYPADYIYWHINDPKRWREVQEFSTRAKIEGKRNK